MRCCVLSVALLAACGPDDPKSDEAPPPEDSPSPAVDTSEPEVPDSGGGPTEDSGTALLPCGVLQSVTQLGGPGAETTGPVTIGADGSTWTVGSFDQAIVFDAGGPHETTLAADGAADVFLARYAADGSFDRVRRHSIGGSLAPTSDGGVVLYGSAAGPITLSAGEPDAVDASGLVGRNAVVARFDATGALLWTARIAGAFEGDTSDVVVLPDDSVVFTGGFEQNIRFGEGEPGEIALDPYPSADKTGFVARLRPDGTVAWAERFGGVEWTSGSGLAVDPSTGDVVVTGGVSGAGIAEFPADPPVRLATVGERVGHISRWTADGEVRWARLFGEIPLDIDVAPDGAALVFGVLYAPAVFGAAEPNETTLDPRAWGEMFTARFDAAGALSWAVQTKSDPDGVAMAYAGGATADGGAVVAGMFWRSSLFGEGDWNATVLHSTKEVDYDGFVARYDGSGGLLCVVPIRGPSEQQAVDLARRADGTWTVSSYSIDAALFGASTPEETWMQVEGQTDGFLANWSF